MENVSMLQLQQPETQRHDSQQPEVANPPMRMVFIDRVSKLPVVEGTMKITNNLYVKVKGANSFFNWSLDKAECTASNIANITAPVLSKLQGPIEKLDDCLCVGLDYVERKVPAVRLPANVIYEHTKQCVNESVQPCVDCASCAKNYGAKKLKEVCRACGVGGPETLDAPEMEQGGVGTQTLASTS